MKKSIVLSILMVFLLAGLANAKMGLRTGMLFNSFSDSRLTGQNTGVEIEYDLDAITVSYKVEQGNLTFTNSLNSANTMQLKTKIDSLTFSKNVANVADGINIAAGLEIGTLTTTCLAGTVAAVAGLNQVNPLVGVNGKINYESTAKNGVTAVCSFLLGYRIVKINELAAVPYAGGEQLKDLNSLNFGINVGLKF